MKSMRQVAAVLAAVGFTWGAAHAGPEAAEAMPEMPVIILELQPIAPGEAAGGELMVPGGEQEQMMLGMLLLQLLSAMQAEGENVEVQFAAPQEGQRI